MNHSIWYVGGKSAGHIIPLITLAGRSNEIPVFITTHRVLDKMLIDGARTSDTVHCPLYIPDIRKKNIHLYPWYMLVLVYALGTLFFVSKKTRPKKIISTGGICALPVFIYAFCARIPCEFFELNAVPGEAVKALIPLSSSIFYCYKNAVSYFPEKKAHYRPYPVRLCTLVSKYEACNRLGLDHQKKTICIVGGSQGSHALNMIAINIITAFKPENIQVIHQTGSADLALLKRWYREKKYNAYVVDFTHDIDTLYSACDKVICRAGAGTLWELDYVNIPTAIIPLNIDTTNHQLYNAQALSAQKPQQFTYFLQDQIEKNPASLISWIGLEQESQSHEDHLYE